MTARNRDCNQFSRCRKCNRSHPLICLKPWHLFEFIFYYYCFDGWCVHICFHSPYIQSQAQLRLKAVVRYGDILSTFSIASFRSIRAFCLLFGMLNNGVPQWINLKSTIYRWFYARRNYKSQFYYHKWNVYVNCFMHIPLRLQHLSIDFHWLPIFFFHRFSFCLFIRLSKYLCWLRCEHFSSLQQLTYACY